MNKASILILLFLAHFSSCKNDYSKRYIQKKRAGVIESEGFFLNDTVKVGMHKTYFPNGRIKSIDMYDDLGKLNGESLIYYENGKVWQKRIFENDSLSKDFFEFFPNGNLKTKAFYFKDRRVGDIFFYEESGHLKNYNFIDFYGNNLIYGDYGVGDRKINEIQGIDQFLEDTLDVVPYNKKSQDTLELYLIIAHVPYTDVKMKINELDKNDSVLHEYSLSTDKTFLRLRFRPLDSMRKLRIIGVLYDSIDSKRKTIISDHRFINVE
jgi:hypothetical protein